MQFLSRNYQFAHQHWASIILLWFILLSTGALYGQSIEQVGQGQILRVSGGVNTNHVFYTRSDTIERRDPYNYFVTGNLNFDLYGWSVPLSFTYSNQNTSFQQPFNQYGLTPTYKWITAHAGWSAMTFTPYTLGGHVFLGGGVELNLDSPWNFKAMYGRLIKPVAEDTTREDRPEPAYRRMGYGFMGGYKKGNDYVDLILFRAADEINSIPLVTDTLALPPQENLVLSIRGGKQLFGKVVLNMEYAISGLTEDTRQPDSAAVERNVFSLAGPLFTQKPSSAYYDAFKTSLNYQGKAYVLGVAYERIDPGYATLGAYFFNNDLENITVNLNTRLLRDKVNLGFNLGTQRNNLDDTELSSTRRWVGSTNLAVAASPRLNLSASYSNFTTFTNARQPFELINNVTQYDLLDTLNFRQISQNANINAFYLLKQGEEVRQNLSLNLSAQNSSDEQNGVDQGSGNRFYNLNTSWALQLLPQNMSMTVAFNASKNDAGEIQTTTLGPTVAVNRSFLEKKLRGTLSLSYNQTQSNGELVNRVTNARANASYTLKEKHNFNLSIIVLNRGAAGSNPNPFTEYTTTFSYSYSF